MENNRDNKSEIWDPQEIEIHAQLDLFFDRGADKKQVDFNDLVAPTLQQQRLVYLIVTCEKSASLLVLGGANSCSCVAYHGGIFVLLSSKY